jgi:hypothetical protein
LPDPIGASRQLSDGVAVYTDQGGLFPAWSG